MLADLLQGELVSVLIVFARLGSALMLLPGFGERTVPARIRLVLALVASALVAGPLDLEASLPTEPTALAALVIPEIVLGLFAGLIARTSLLVAHLAGAIIAVQSGLAAATLYDPNEGDQSAVPAAFLTTVLVAVFFASDTHHTVLRWIVASYERVPPGTALPLADMAALFGPYFDAAMATAAAIAAPVIAGTMLVNIVLALANRLMPALQVFALVIPLQLLLYFGLASAGIGSALVAFDRNLDAVLSTSFDPR